jgi:hypothetical protein
VEAIKTEREKQQQAEVVPVEDSFPEREPSPAPLDGVDDPMVVPSDEEDWVVKLEQSVNIFLTVIQVPELISPPPRTPDYQHKIELIKLSCVSVWFLLSHATHSAAGVGGHDTR